MNLAVGSDVLSQSTIASFTTTEERGEKKDDWQGEREKSNGLQLYL